MTRKIVILLGVGGVLLAVFGIAALRWAARQAPDFYESAMKAHPRPENRDQAARVFAERTAKLVQKIKYESNWEQEFSQSRVNAWLADEMPHQYANEIPPGVSDARVKFDDGRIWFGFRLRNSQFDGIVSLVVRPEVTAPNHLTISVESLSAGLLPLTASAFTDDVSRELTRFGVHHRWDIAGSKPVLHVKITPAGAERPILEELQVDDEQLRITGYRTEPRALTMRGL